MRRRLSSLSPLSSILVIFFAQASFFSSKAGRSLTGYIFRLHQTLQIHTHGDKKDLTGGLLGQETTVLSYGTKSSTSGSDSDITPDGDEPTEYEKRHLRRIGENLPLSAFLIAIVELTERFTYYGAQGLFQNYVSHHADGRDGAPGLGLGHQAATGLNLMFQWLCYVTPFFGAILADQYLGKYNAILVFCGVYWVGLVVLWTTALPASIESGSSIPGFIVALVIIGFGTGGIKSNIAPLIADQYQRRTMAVKTLNTGERVIIDIAITYQRIYMVFYWCINLGSMSLLATPFIEKSKGFWASFLLCFCMFHVSILILVIRRKSYIVRPPQGSIITNAFKAIGLMIRSRDLNAAKPSWRENNNKVGEVPWSDHFVEELKRALRACKVFVFYPVFWVCYNQFSNNFVTQAGQMEGHGIPNDMMQNFDAISILVFTPLLEFAIYPFLRRLGYELRPIARIGLGFWFAALGVGYAAIVQHLIYSAGPCYDAPGACPEGMDGNSPLPNHVHIAIQTPAYVFMALAEIFVSVTGLEYAYTKAPPSMKSFVQATYLFIGAFSAALGEALVPVAKDPLFLWMYTGIAIAAFVTGCLTYAMFHHYDDMEEEAYDLDRNEPVLEMQGKKQV